MLQITSGSILIDNIDISTISQEILCSKLIVLSQEPLFLPGPIRHNINMWSFHSDREIESVLRKVCLWEKIIEVGGLSQDMNVNQLSRGQQQLFCVARALLKDAAIVLLDEVTSGLGTISIITFGVANGVLVLTT